MPAAAEPLPHLHHRRTVFDGWRSLSIALYMTLVGYGVLVGIPVISTAWVELLGFTEEQVGRVAGADLGGLAFGAVVASLLVGRVNRRVLVLASGGLAIAANALCMVYHDYEVVLWLRVLSGIGSGTYTAVAMACLGATVKPARAYNLMLFGFAFSQALEMQVLPQLTMNGIYAVFIGCFAVGLLFTRWVPPRPVEPALDVELDVAEPGGRLHVEHRHVPAWVPWLCMAAIMFTYVNIGGYWTYIELAALDAAVNDAFIGRVLVWSSFWSLVGCAFATLLSDRFGLARPLMFSLLAMAVTVGMLASGLTPGKLLASVFFFNLLWIFIDVYQMSTVANVDRSGAFAALIPGAQGLGQIIGPNISASLLAYGAGYATVFRMCSMAALTGLAVYALMYVRLRRTLPALADSS